MPGPNTDISIVDGSLDFSGGVNSIKVRTVSSERTPNGLRREELAWLNNATVRDGGISPRAGWQPLGKVHDGQSRYQGWWIYTPIFEHPYFLIAIGGHILKVEIDPEFVIRDLSVESGEFHPADLDYFFFVQAEHFAVIQAGDMTTLPLIWDGTTLRRSLGIQDMSVAPGTPGVNEIPAAGPMAYYMGRLWYAIERTVYAGDLVHGPSGTSAHGFRDSILNVTENPLVIGGDGFTMPGGNETIRAMMTGGAIDTQLGQGRLFISTRKQIFALQVPVTRADWIASDSNNHPLVTVIQQVNGAVNDRSVVPVNGDLFFQSLEPGIRSLILASRSFSEPGNLDLSAPVRRLIQYNDRSLLRFASGIAFDNRLLQTALPMETPQGVVHQAIVPLDFMPSSTVSERRRPHFEGMYEGLDFFQLASGEFGGLERAFGIIRSRVDGSIQIWELTYAYRREHGDNRVAWIVEFPAYHGDSEATLKRLMTGELWLDRLWGTVYFKMEYRPDGENCWLPWHQWNVCNPRTSLEQDPPTQYPIEEFGQGYAQPIRLPAPPSVCQHQMGRPSDIGYQFQARLTVIGNCRVRGLLMHMQPREESLYSHLPSCDFAEFPSATLNVWHEFMLPDEPLTQIDLGDEPEPEPEPEEDEDMPLHHAIYVAEKDAIYGVHGGLIYKFDPDTGDAVMSHRLIQPDWGPTWLTYVPGEDRLLSTYWQPSQFINARRGFFILNPETLEEISFVNYLDIFGPGYTSYHNGPFQTMWQNDELFAVMGRSGTSSRWTRFGDFFVDPTDFELDGTTAFYAQGEMAFNPEAVIADADVGFRTGPTFATVPMFHEAGDVSGVHLEIIGEYDVGGISWFTIYSTELDHVPTSICYAGDQRYYMSTKSNFVVKAVDAGWTGGGSGGLDVTISYIDMGIGVAPLRIRYNPHNGKIYMPDMVTNQVIIFDPATDTVEAIKTGFSSPLDVVFTPTKAFAVQQRGRALKEIV